MDLHALIRTEAPAAEQQRALTEPVLTALVDHALGGGSSVFESSALQRCLRDAHTANQHTIVSRRLLETYSMVRLGLGPDTARF